MSDNSDNQYSRFESWVNTYGDDMVRWAFHKTGNQATSEDLVQETFLAAYKAIDNFRQESKPKTWLFSILNNKITDFHRKNFRQAARLKRVEIDAADGEKIIDYLFDKVGSWREDMKPTHWHDMDSNLLDNHEFARVMASCMQQLPESWSSAMHLKYMQEKDGKEICQELGISSSNYWQILHRAKLQLRVCIEKHWFKS